MLKLKKIICTAFAATALFTGPSLTSAVDHDKPITPPFTAIEADAAKIWGEYYIKGWEPVRTKPNSTAPLIGAYSNCYVYGTLNTSNNYIYVCYSPGKYGYVKYRK